jgi:hypothetical protein
MTAEYNPNEERFDEGDCGAALLTAVRQLAVDCGTTLEEFKGPTLAHIALRARETYGDGLPEFWDVWESWHAPDSTPEMGDL